MDYSLELDPASVCRVCLEPQEHPQTIFTKHIIEGNIKTLPELILNCFAVDVIANPDFPKNICDTCKSSVIQFYKFREKVIGTEKLLNEIFKTEDQVSCKQEQVEFEEYHDNEASMDKTMVEEEVELEDEFTEDVQQVGVVCEEIMTSEGEDDAHPTQFEVFELENAELGDQEITSVELIDETTLYGEFDEETYVDENAQDEEDEDKKSINLEMVKPDYDEDVKVDIIPKKRRYRRSGKDGESKATATLMCKICNKRIKIEDENHDKLHECYGQIMAGETFLQCYRCDQIFICAEELHTHLLQMHYENVEQSVAEEAIIGELHVLDEDVARTVWVCGYCSFDFSNLSDLKMHMVTHVANIACPIDDCGFQYGNFHYFYQHIRRNHLTTKLLSCKYCGKSNITDFRTMQNHYRSECTAKKYKCEFCSRTFFTDKSWKTHMDIRHIEKKFICELCGKSFAQITELRIHTRMHTGERPFACTICKKAYKTASGRACHMDSHSNKVYPCEKCGKQMNSRRNLVSHIRRHTEEKKLKCEVCSKKFFTKWHLNLHASKMHNNIK